MEQLATVSLFQMLLPSTEEGSEKTLSLTDLQHKLSESDVNFESLLMNKSQPVSNDHTLSLVTGDESLPGNNTDVDKNNPPLGIVLLSDMDALITQQEEIAYTMGAQQVAVVSAEFSEAEITNTDQKDDIFLKVFDSAHDFAAYEPEPGTMESLQWTNAEVSELATVFFVPQMETVKSEVKDSNVDSLAEVLKVNTPVDNEVPLSVLQEEAATPLKAPAQEASENILRPAQVNMQTSQAFSEQLKSQVNTNPVASQDVAETVVDHQAVVQHHASMPVAKPEQVASVALPADEVVATLPPNSLNPALVKPSLPQEKSQVLIPASPVSSDEEIVNAPLRVATASEKVALAEQASLSTQTDIPKVSKETTQQSAPQVVSHSVHDVSTSSASSLLAPNASQEIISETRAPVVLHAKQALPDVQVHEQVTVRIQQALAEDLDRITIRLNPPELGKLDIRLDILEGRAQVLVTADNKDAYELLQRDAQQLEKALKEAGLDVDSNSLQFDLRGDEHQQASQGEDAQKEGSMIDVEGQDEKEDTSQDVSELLMDDEYQLVVSDGVDIKV